MFKKLMRHWKVNGLQMALILLTFALGGSICGRAAAWLLKFIPADEKWVEVLIFIGLCTLLWPVSVILVSIPLGQFRFFKKYILKIAGRFSGKHRVSLPVTRIAIFASGTGSNAQQLINHFRNSTRAEIGLIVSNKPGAGVLSIAAAEKIPSLLVTKENFFSANSCLKTLDDHKISLIVLAGFLWKIPVPLIRAYPRRIINIHPALLPKYGGKGMYGHFVHDAVIRNREKVSGITIHYVDEIYDHGETLFQASLVVDENDTAETLANKIHALEHAHYPQVIERIVTSG
jgi:formyltetrahydrofolate-dependent phosphoribosylglycinamide formyltransferase